MKLHITTRGHGADLVLLHGWAMHGGVFDPVMEALAPHYRVHAIDLPGHGQSALPLELKNVEDMVAAMVSYVPPNAIMLGWSLGGLLATYLAVQLQLRALVLVSTTPKFVADHAWTHGMAPTTFAQFSQRLQQNFSGTVEDFLRLQVRGDSDAAATLKELRERLLQHPQQEAALSLGLKILRDSDARAQLATIKVPTLVVAGEHDRITHPDASEYVAAQLPQARLRVIKRAGHAPFISHRHEFLHELQDFLKGLPA